MDSGRHGHVDGLNRLVDRLFFSFVFYFIFGGEHLAACINLD
jgi:hypothetical protein